VNEQLQYPVSMRSTSLQSVFIIIQIDGINPQRGGWAFVVDAMASTGTM
jgi:hypothetical protein